MKVAASEAGVRETGGVGVGDGVLRSRAVCLRFDPISLSLNAMCLQYPGTRYCVPDVFFAAEMYPGTTVPTYTITVLYCTVPGTQYCTVYTVLYGILLYWRR